MKNCNIILTEATKISALSSEKVNKFNYFLTEKFYHLINVE